MRQILQARLVVGAGFLLPRSLSAKMFARPRGLQVGEHGDVQVVEEDLCSSLAYRLM